MSEVDTEWYRTFVQQLDAEACMAALPRGCQYRDVTSAELFDLLLPRVPESWDFLTQQRLTYVADLKFPLTNHQTGHINRLKFQNGRKEFRTMFFKSIHDKVCQMVFSSPQTYNPSKVQYVLSHLKSRPAEGTATENDPIASLIPDELLEKVTSFLTPQDMETIQNQLNDLTTSYGNLDLPSIISAAQSDPRFTQLQKTFEGIFQGKPAEFDAVFAEHTDVFEKLQSGGGARLETMLPSLVTRSIADMTKPELPDDDPMLVSEAQFEALRKEYLGSKNHE